MPGVEVVLTGDVLGSALGQIAGGFDSPAEVFNGIFTVFLGLGTLVGTVVVTYTLFKAYKYRDGDGHGVGADVERPEMGELPQGGGGGKKLFLSFGISAVIVLSLILWTYNWLLYVEDVPTGQDAQEEALEVDVVGNQFSWQFTYPSGQSSGTMMVPKGRPIKVNVTSADVFHNFGIPEFRVKTDAIPGQHSEAWFVANETGTYEAVCYELCGSGHSYMTADVKVVTRDEFQSWYNGSGDAS